MRIFFLFSLFLFSCVSEKENPNKFNHVTEIVKISQFIENDITNDSLYVIRAEINIKKQNYQEALKDLNQAVILDSTNGYAHYLIGDILLDLAKQIKGTENSLLLALQHFNNSILLESNLAYSYQKAGEIMLYLASSKDIYNFSEAIDLLIKSSIINDKIFKTYDLLGYCYMEIGDYKNSINSYQKSISLNPGNEEAYLQIGNLFSMNYDLNAVEYYEKVIELNPKNRIAQYNIGILYQNNQMYLESQESYHKLFDGTEDKIYSDANFNLGFIFMEDLNDFKNAINYFADAVRVNPNYYTAYYSMGLCYQSFGDIKNAEKFYRKSLDIYPDYELSIKSLNKLLKDNKKYK